MIARISLVLNLRAAFFKSKSRLEAVNARSSVLIGGRPPGDRDFQRQ
jgi:hypothetical protein